MGGLFLYMKEVVNIDKVILNRKERLLYDYKNALIKYEGIKSYAATYSGRQYGSVRSRMFTYEDYVASLEKCLIKEFDYDVDKYKKEVLTYETI